MLHDVGQVDLVAIDPRFAQRAIERFAGRPDEGMSFEIFLVARLLSDHDDGGFARTFAKDGLRRAAPEMTRLAAVRRSADARE
jgi:hypothetical protein